MHKTCLRHHLAGNTIAHRWKETGRKPINYNVQTATLQRISYVPGAEEAATRKLEGVNLLKKVLSNAERVAVSRTSYEIDDGVEVLARVLVDLCKVLIPVVDHLVRSQLLQTHITNFKPNSGAYHRTPLSYASY